MGRIDEMNQGLLPHHWWVPRFADELIRPLAVATVSGISVVQLVSWQPTGLTVFIWVLTFLVIIAAVLALLPWRHLRASVQVALVCSFAVLGALLFSLTPSTAAAVFVFIASATAGEKLAWRQAAFTVAIAATAVAALSTWVAESVHLVPGRSPWWLCLVVGLPVYIGTAHRDRTDALAAAEFAVAEGERSAALEARGAVLEERGRIARDIHDVLGHSLSGIAIQLDMADALHCSGRDDEANQAVKRARALAVLGSGETQRAIQALREDTLPLANTIGLLAHNNAASFESSGDIESVSVEVAQTVIRAAQEALTNARRYAPGAAVDLRLDYTPDSISLTVADVGTTGTPPTSSGSGMGLVGMRERASLLGGTVQAGPADPPARGWIVRMELPR